MLEENQNQPEPSLEGFVPEQPDQGTPQETPPGTEVSDGQQPPVETPGTPDSTKEEVDGAAQEKTPEQVSEDRAYHQQEAQAAKEELARIRDQFAVQAPAEQPATQPSTPQAEPDRGWLSGMGGLSDEEINEKLRDDPILQMQLADHRQEQRFNAILDKRDAATRAETRYSEEANATSQHLESFCKKHEIPRTEMFKIKDDLLATGIQGSPAAIGGLIQDRLNSTLIQRNIDGRATQAAAKAAQAIKTQSLTTQPEAGGESQPAPAGTMEEKIAAAFKPSSGTEAVNQLFD